jgi:hypothetical protein
MWLVYIDILWVWSHLFAVLSVGYVIAIYYILNEKSFEKNVLNIVLKFIGFSEGFLGLLSGYSVLAIMTLTKHETTIFYNFLYIFPLMNILQSLVILSMPKRFLDEKINRKSLLLTFFIILGILVMAKYFNYIVFLAGSMAIGMNTLIVRMKDWFEMKKIFHKGFYTR